MPPTRDRALSGTNEGREPHSISLKVLRLSRPSLANQHPISVQSSDASEELGQLTSLSYSYPTSSHDGPFILSPLLTFPPAFGSAYVGEQFSCCLCANICSDTSSAVKDVKITAQMQTPSLTIDLTLTNGEAASDDPPMDATGPSASETGDVLSMSGTLQKIVKHDLKEGGNHVLSVTVSYNEPLKTGEEGFKLRTFRKLYQFVVMQCLTVRTKTGEVPTFGVEDIAVPKQPANVILEAQLENMAETPISLEVVNLNPRKGWLATSLNWDNASLLAVAGDARFGPKETPILKNRDIMQVAFLLEPDLSYAERKDEPSAQLKIEWRSACGDRGFLSTGYLSVKRKT